MPLPSLKLCHRMCGPNLEPNLRPVLSSTNLRPSNPEALESRGLPNPGLADDQFLPRPRVLPHQVGHAEVMPGQAQNLPGLCTSRPGVQPLQKGLADDQEQSRLLQDISKPLLLGLHSWP